MQAQQEALRFPLSMTAPRQDLDKKGEPATVYDCCLNDDVVKMVRGAGCGVGGGGMLLALCA